MKISFRFQQARLNVEHFHFFLEDINYLDILALILIFQLVDPHSILLNYYLNIRGSLMDH